MLIACDVDGVLSDLAAEWYRRYNRDYDDNLTPDRVKSWATHKYVRPACGARIYDYLHDPDLYLYVEPVPGAQKGVRALQKLGHRVVYVTSNVKGMTDQKWDWLERHGFLKTHHRAAADLVVMHDKTLVDADVLIDDRGEYIVEWVNGKRRKGILYSHPWNAWMLDDMPSAFWLWCHRVKNWEEIVKYFNALSPKEAVFI